MNRIKLFLPVTLAALGLIPAVAQANHKPGHSPGGGGSGNLTLQASPNPVKYGRTVLLTGRLTGNNNSGVAVSIFNDPFPYDAFTAAGTATTNSSGEYQIGLKPRVNTRYQARQGGEQSAVVTVPVRPAVSLRLSDYTPEAGQRVRFSGRVCPQHDGASLSIQRRYSTGYRTIRRTTLRDIPGSTCSSYRRTFRVYRDGRFRAVIGGHSDHATGLSRSRVANAHS